MLNTNINSKSSNIAHMTMPELLDAASYTKDKKQKELYLKKFNQVMHQRQSKIINRPGFTI